MALSLRVGAMIVLGMLGLPAVCRAQNKDKPRNVQTSSIAGEVHGTPIKKTPALTDDDIALLALRPAAKLPEASRTDSAAKTSTIEPGEAAQDPEKVRAEIATLEQQIKDKQRKIQLLMRMFVIDEQAFLKDPSGQSEEQEARAKRRYEQEELLQQGKDIARLRARLEQIAPPGSAKQAPVKSVAAN